MTESQSALASTMLFVGTASFTVWFVKMQRAEKIMPQGRTACSLSKPTTMALRQKHFSKCLSISYKNTGPLMIVKGVGCRLVDEQGVSYLDTRNNVAHCGHGHPRIVRAVQEQLAQLNTNTRYLHPNMALLAERLLNLLPDPLDVVFFCNSGSEANDLALRLARAHSGGSNNTIVVDGAYHGHTLAALEVSPYKYEHGAEYSGKSPGQHIYKVPCPDVFRGKHRDRRTAGREYAAYVEQACHMFQERGERVRAFIIEGGMSVAGVILPPPGYLQACVDAVHQAGGLYIADEVQTGFGRLGSSFWAFQHQENPSEPQVVPDIVTVGKPFGNGMPLAAVVTSRHVVSAFEECGVEYFNTFAGNPVCAAAGLAVLEVMEEENLQKRAMEVGTYLQDRFRELARSATIIGDVRGSGFFIGIELVRSRGTLEPATAETSYICSLLKTKYKILTSIDGLHNNVLVIKPPMVFSMDDADYFVDAFKKVVTMDLSQVADLALLCRTAT